MMKHTWIRNFCISILLGLTLPSLSVAQVADQIGKSWMEALRRDPYYVDDALVQDYIETVVERIMPKAADNQVREVAVLIDDEFNAFALPGGYIGVYSSLFRHLNTSGQFAAIMAHEIAHVTQHHFERILSNAGKSTAIAIASLVAGLVARNSTVSVATIAAGQGLAIQNRLNFSREMEIEADRAGLQYLRNANIDIKSMREALTKMRDLQRLSENEKFPYLRTHPLSQERVLEVDMRLNEMSVSAADAAFAQADEQDYAFIRARVLAEHAERDSGFAKQLGEQLQSLRLPESAQAYLQACLLWQAQKRAEALELLQTLAKHNTLSDYAQQVLALTELEWLKEQRSAQWLTQARHYQKQWTNKRAFRSALITALSQNGELEQAADLLRVWIAEGQNSLHWWEAYATVAQARQKDFEYLRARIEIWVLKERYDDALNLLKSIDISRFTSSEQLILRARINAIGSLKQ